MHNKSFNTYYIMKKKLTILTLKKTNSNVFVCLYKYHKMFFSLSFYSFIKKNQKNAYKLFWYRLFKFIEVRLDRFKIKKFNLIIYGKLLYKYKNMFKVKKIYEKIGCLFYKTGVSHNGCKLKKKKRK